MTLIIEDGTVVPNANSYITVDEYKSWADARGINTTHSDNKIEQGILRAMDWFERQFYIGNKANENQPLQWPRTEALIDGYYEDATEIPPEVDKALYEATKVELDGFSELNNQDRKTVREQIGDISVTYADNSNNRVITPALRFAMNRIVRPAGMVSRA